MAIFEQIATKADLAKFLAVEETSLPINADRLLLRASELIQQAMLNNYNKSNTEHVEAAKLAVCAQVECWIEAGEGVAGPVQSYSVGDVSVNFGANSQNRGQLAIRAKMFLNQQGLLYRGVKCDRRHDEL